MAIIENKIQYYWVRNRVAKLQKLIAENTPANSPYRIELELLSKLEKEYSEESANALEQEIEAVITNNVEKKKINIYEGLPMILEKVKAVALAAVMGKSCTWLDNKLKHYVIKNNKNEFIEKDLLLINSGLENLGNEILQNIIQFNSDREEVIQQIKNLSAFVCMPYLYGEMLNKKRTWYAPRMLSKIPGRKVCVFKEEDIHQINMAAMQIANELKSIEFVL